VRRHLSNPDWYRIRYSLAAERVNWALADGGARGVQLLAAEIEAWDLLSAINRWLGRPKSWGLRAIRDDSGPALDAFLRDPLKPSLLVLLAGIELARYSAWEEQEPAQEGGAEALGQFEEQILSGAAVDPFLMVQAVEASYREPSPGILYNLACFHAQAGNSSRALESLGKTVEATPPSAWPRLRAEIESDPMFGSIRREASDLFEDPVKYRAKQPARRRHFRI
jgi:hypothetical protein